MLAYKTGPLPADRQERTLEPEQQEGIALSWPPGHIDPCPSHNRHPASLSSPNVCQPCKGVSLFSVLLSRPLQMGWRWEMQHCTLLALGLVGPGHCLRLPTFQRMLSLFLHPGAFSGGHGILEKSINGILHARVGASSYISSSLSPQLACLALHSRADRGSFLSSKHMWAAHPIPASLQPLPSWSSLWVLNSLTRRGARPAPGGNEDKPSHCGALHDCQTLPPLPRLLQGTSETIEHPGHSLGTPPLLSLSSHQ